MGEGKEKKDGKGGVATDETMILACQCGHTKFDVKKRTRTSIALVCVHCGLPTSVKGNLATIRVKQQEIEYAMGHTVITPDDTPPGPPGDGGQYGNEAGETPGDGSGPLGVEYVTRKYRMLGTQAAVVDRVMEKIRIMNCSDDRYREQTWQGHAIEFMAADCESGMPTEVNTIYDAMEMSVADAGRIAEEGGKSAPNARRIRQLKVTVRDKLAVECGILPPDFLGPEHDPRQLHLLPAPELITPVRGTVEEATLVCPECDGEVSETDTYCLTCGVAFSVDLVDTGKETEPEGNDADAVDDDAPCLMPDDGRLMASVVSSLEQYVEDAREQGLEEGEIPEYVVVAGPNPSEETLKDWAEMGGYLIRIYGDKRTSDEDGQRPSVTAYITKEPAGLSLDFSLEYDELTDDLKDGEVNVAELLPPDYADGPSWAMPHFADTREQL